MNRGLKENIYFWRDNVGHEIDCIAEKDDGLRPIEIKSGKTVSTDFFKGLSFYTELSQDTAVHPTVVYAGATDQMRKDGNVLTWKSFGKSIPGDI
jgi:predicted AAA+ superfamily ATPase